MLDHSPKLVRGSMLGGFFAETCLGSTLGSSPKLVWGQRWVPLRNLLEVQRWVPRRNLFGGQRWVFCRNLFGVNPGFLAETCLGSMLDSSPKLVWGQRWISCRNLVGVSSGFSPKLVWCQRWVPRRNLFGVKAGCLAGTCLGVFLSKTCGFLPGRAPLFQSRPSC